MSEDFAFNKLSNIGCDLTATMVEMAEGLYRKRHGTPPTTILIPPEETIRAYEILATVPSITKMAIVPVPGLPKYAWAVGGQYEFLWSPGA